MEENERREVLTGVRVVDLTRLLPGPYCSMLLGDMGAEIIKIEPPGGSDYLREYSPRQNREGAMYLALNRNKKCITLNLKSRRGKDIFLELVKSADVVLESFRPGVMDGLGLGYQELQKVNPGVIYCAITGYGQDGPYAGRAGHDLNYLSLAGVLGYTGTRNGVPGIPGVQVADIGGGSMPAAFSIMAALFYREKTGEGQFIDVSMTDSVLSWLSMHAGKYFADGINPGPGSELLNGGVPCYNIYRTRDGGYMTLGALEPHFWSEFCKAVGREDLLKDQFATGDRGQIVIQELEKVFISKTKEQWVEFFQDVDCCCEPVNNFKETFQHPQVRQREMVREVEHPTEGSLKMLNFPVKFSRSPGSIKTPPPALGEHNEEILRGLGFSQEEIEKLRKEGIL